MTKDLAVKWARYGITINAICPGWFPTSMNERHLEAMADKLIPRVPLGRYGGKQDLKGM
jgi:NAD(P)-dependent dehydrogenase (short-subunit alcohol dehydrogenase family)